MTRRTQFFLQESNTMTTTPVHIYLQALGSMLDVYESWIFSENEDCTQPPPYGWSVKYYDDLCEWYNQVMSMNLTKTISRL